MGQVLKGSLTGLCARCRFAAPNRRGDVLYWRCVHAGVELVEVDGRIVARRLDREPVQTL